MSADRIFVSELVAECLAAIEVDGLRGLDRVCAEHPDHEAVLRRRIALLGDSGLYDVEAEAAEPKHPESLGPFRVVRSIASGGMGVVYEAVDTSSDEELRCAVKVVRPELAFVPGSRARFLREIESVRRLEHPGIVSIHAVGQSDGVPYFAMELIDGLGLGELLARVHGVKARASMTLAGGGGMELWRALGGVREEGAPDRLRGSWAEACCFLIREAAAAVDHSHQRGVLHRDLKPNNIMLARDGRVIVLDFGLARIEGDARLTASRSLLGSLHYAAPEILASGSSGADRRADVYSLGASLFELLTGRAPFEGDSEQVVRSAIAAGRIPKLRDLNPSLPRPLEWIVSRALEHDPARRYATAGDFARDLDALVELRPIVAGPPSAMRVLARWTRRHPGFVTAIALVLVASIVVPWLVYSIEREHSTRLRRNYESATETVRRVGTELAESTLARTPGLARQRIRVLAEVVRFHVEAAGDEPSASTQRDAAIALRRLGDCLVFEGRGSEALEHFEDALARCHAARAHGLDPRIACRVEARVLGGIARVHHERSELADAEALYRRAIEVLRPVERGPFGALAATQLRNGLARALVALDRVEDAAAIALEALSVGDIAIEESATDAEKRQARIERGFALLSTYAADRCEAALSTFEGLFATDPADPFVREGLAAATYQSALDLRRQARHEVARDRLERSAALWRRLTDDFPGRPSLRLGYGCALEWLGVQAETLEPHAYESARLHYGRALEVLREGVVIEAAHYDLLRRASRLEERLLVLGLRSGELRSVPRDLVERLSTGIPGDPWPHVRAARVLWCGYECQAERRWPTLSRGELWVESLLRSAVAAVRRRALAARAGQAIAAAHALGFRRWVVFRGDRYRELRARPEWPVSAGGAR